MFAGIDIGNTTLRLMVFNGSDIENREVIYSIDKIDFDSLLGKIINVDYVIIVSVVDWVEKSVIKCLDDLRIRFYTIKMKNVSSIDFSLYKSNLGSDRVATCLGALSYNRLPFCVIDMGTATTFSIVDKDRIYRGGFIVPGVGTMLRSLKEFTAKLPLVDIEKEKGFDFGLSTEDSIKNGVYLLNYEGFSSIIRNIKSIYSDIAVIGTGGWSKFFYKIFDIYDPYLIFKGINYFARSEI